MVTSNTGVTSLQNLERVMPRIMAAARVTEEHDGQIAQLCEHHRLKPGTGTVWIEPQMGQVEAQDITPHQDNRNPQQIQVVRLLEITPRPISVQIVIADETQPHIQSTVWMQMGVQGQRAIQRKKDIDGIVAFNASGNVNGAAAPFNINDLDNHVTRMQGNPEEPAKGQMRAVLHRYQIQDVRNLLVNPGNIGSATYGEVSRGLTAEVFRMGFKGMLSGAKVFEDNHIPISAGTNIARAMVFPRQGAVLVMDSIREYETDRWITYGQGATLAVMRRRYAFGLRNPHIFNGVTRSTAVLGTG